MELTLLIDLSLVPREVVLQLLEERPFPWTVVERDGSRKLLVKGHLAYDEKLWKLLIIGLIRGEGGEGPL